MTVPGWAPSSERRKRRTLQKFEPVQRRMYERSKARSMVRAKPASTQPRRPSLPRHIHLVASPRQTQDHAAGTVTDLTPRQLLEQLHHLLSLSIDGSISVRVVARNYRPKHVLPGGFALIDFPDQPAVLYRDLYVTGKELYASGKALGAHESGKSTPSDDTLAARMTADELRLMAATLRRWVEAEREAPPGPDV